MAAEGGSMMGVYIKGMEMPDIRQAYAGLIIRWDGKVYPFFPPQGYELVKSVATAVPVPPHGDLIDRDEQIERAWKLKLSTRELIEEMLKSAPTIIPAEPPKEEKDD